MASNKVSAVILAGGQSRRMGRHKALLPYDDGTFLDALVKQLQGLVTDVVIGGCPESGLYSDSAATVLNDPDGLDSVGPLAGLLAAMEKTSAELVFCVPCDNPVIPENLLANLTVVLNREQADIAYVYDGDRMQPLYGLFRTALKQNLGDYLSSGERKVYSWVRSQKAVAVDFSKDKSLFCNINSAEDYEKFVSSLS